MEGGTFHNLPINCARYLLSLLGYDDALYNHRLWRTDHWQVAAVGSDPDMLGSPVRKHELGVKETFNVSIKVSRISY
jgi:hypothetical protein